MSTVKSFSVGGGDMFYIKHISDNFTVIDCCLDDDNKDQIINELIDIQQTKNVTRFISTHPDQDHVQGLKYLDNGLSIQNFYCIRNEVVKEVETVDFNHYCKLRDSDKAFYIHKGCSRKWMNLESNERGSAGINILWPETSNESFKNALKIAESGGSPNNTSAIIKYSLKNSATVLWMGDMETEFMEKIMEAVNWPQVDILFAPHHGRNSGKVPNQILSVVEPSVIILGEAPSENLNYYQGYNTISQNSAGDIRMDCQQGEVHFFVSEKAYSASFLSYDSLQVFNTRNDHYIGSLRL